jgi:NADPH2:quinone reductase
MDDETLFGPYEVDLTKLTPEEAARVRRRAARFAKRPKMRAVFCERHGGPETLVVKELDWPGKPGPGEVKVQLWARSVSFVDMLQIAGRYQVRQPPPFIPGSEASGIILDVGEGVVGLKKADKILCPAGWVEEAILPASQVVLAPTNLGFELLSAFRGNYTTAYYGLQRARLQPGETLLVHGASGGVGFAAVDLGKLLGAIVIATGSNDEKLEIVKDKGANHVINVAAGSFAERVKELTGGRGADVVFDPVGGRVFDESLRCVASRARLLVVGFAGGDASAVKTNQLLIKDIEVIGYTMAALARDDPALADRNLKQLIRWVESEHIRPYCSHYLPLTSPAEALQAMCDRKVVGKAVLIS